MHGQMIVFRDGHEGHFLKFSQAIFGFLRANSHIKRTHLSQMPRADSQSRYFYDVRYFFVV